MPGSREWTKKGVILPIKDLVPETAVTDKGPQFSAAFARDCDFTHVINSPWYPPKKKVKTLRSLQTKLLWLTGPLPCHTDHPLQSCWWDLTSGQHLPVSQDKLQPGWPDRRKKRDSQDEAITQNQTEWNCRRDRKLWLVPQGIINPAQPGGPGSSSLTCGEERRSCTMFVQWKKKNPKQTKSKLNKTI